MSTKREGFVTQAGLTRREFLQSGTALFVSLAAPGCATLVDERTAATAAMPTGTTWPLKIDPAQVDSWIRIEADGRVIAAVGKIEAGMGLSTAFTQIVAEELDVGLERVTVLMGDTAMSVDQRGTRSSDGIIEGGGALRKAAAEGRAALVLLASERLRVVPAALDTRDGFVFVKTEPARRLSYGELVAGGKLGRTIAAEPVVREPRNYRLVGKPVQRLDIAPKVRGEYRYITDWNVPGMLHARVIRPPEAGATLLAVRQPHPIPGLIEVVRKGNFLGVVCEREEQAIAAMRLIEADWSRPQPLHWSGYDALYEHLRKAPVKSTSEIGARGDAAAALALAPRTLEARYEYPFQSHASMGPACAVADVRNGGAMVWFSGQKPYALRHGIVDLLRLPMDKVRVMWLPGPGSYGMNDADDCAADCAVLAQAVGRPVRLQYTRADGTGWDPKGPPVAFRMRAGINSAREVFAWDYEARGFSGRTRNNGTELGGDSLAGALIGGYQAKITAWPQFPDEAYGFLNTRKVSHIIDWSRSLGTPLRTSHLRDPDGMATCFASESFADEVAYACGMDPVAFRLRYLTDARHKAVVEAAAKKAGWQAHTAPRAPAGDVVRGQGFAYAPRNGTIVAIVADVEVDRQTGKYRVTRFTCAHDCGFVVNPLNLKGTIEANLIQGMSRAMHEEVRFDPTRVLSVDWITYPIADMTEMPDAIDIVVVGNTPGARSRGAGEPATRPVAAAIANALHDALGVRLRRVPLSPAAVRGALKA